ncbi:ABC transporter permease [Paraburkholderia sp. ZP32-5]|uniref:ABC transporter permease n=1 Tax=Paraburkholderia sp. ZP32-5 TaxID=2883245 RepID=UPI001F43E539|nr:ABC transporter permease [Paraburkholderia sp. ZP32-5]
MATDNAFDLTRAAAPPHARARRTRDTTGTGALLFVLPALVLMAAVFLVPVVYVLGLSIYRDGHFTLEAFAHLISNGLFVQVLGTTLTIAVSATLVSLVLAYPVAMHLARQSPRRRAVYTSLVLLPFWTSILVKSYAFTVILGRAGLINSALHWMFGNGPQLELIFNRTGVMIGMSNYLVPFLVFPILSNLLAQDRNLVQAAEAMGAGAFRTWWKITLPLSLPAVAAGALLSLVISFGFFVTPALLGGPKDMMLANLVDLFTHEALDWNTAAAIAVLILLISAALVAILSRVPGATGRLGK